MAESTKQTQNQQYFIFSLNNLMKIFLQLINLRRATTASIKPEDEQELLKRALAESEAEYNHQQNNSEKQSCSIN